jgi:hypothetical protein
LVICGWLLSFQIRDRRNCFFYPGSAEFSRTAGGVLATNATGFAAMLDECHSTHMRNDRIGAKAIFRGRHSRHVRYPTLLNDRIPHLILKTALYELFASKLWFSAIMKDKFVLLNLIGSSPAFLQALSMIEWFAGGLRL